MFLALGPAHPLWPGPQQLVLRLAGELIVDVEYRDASDEEGLGQQVSRGDAARALATLQRVVPQHAVAHGLALCQALEQAADVVAPPRAAYLRSALAELERLHAHTRVVAQLLSIMGLARRQAALSQIASQARDVLHAVAGERPTELLAPGGLRNEPRDARQQVAGQQLPLIEQTLYAFIDRLIDDRLLLRRCVDVGVLSKTAAEQFGVRGPLARASGIARDVRVDHPYAAYDRLTPTALTQQGGDVYARIVLLLLEAFESVKLARRALEALPDGPFAAPLPGAAQQARGESRVEAPLGQLRYVVVVEGERLQSVQIDAPRPLDRLLARTLLDRALVDNGLLIAASVAPVVGIAP
jgi:ech hydrogenase subunit E